MFEYEGFNKRSNKKKKIIISVIIGVVVILLVLGAVLYYKLQDSKEKNNSANNDILNESNVIKETESQTESLLQLQTKEIETMKIEASTKEQFTQDAFTPVSDNVTAKEETNLRSMCDEYSDLCGTLLYGTYIERTGYSDNGWSRLIYNGKTVYAKTQLLMKEGETKAQISSWIDEFGMTYVKCNDKVTAKDETNLRTSPGSDNPSTVYAVLKKGEYVTRIGKGDKGWDKVEYNGMILYASTMLLTTQ